MNVSPLPGLAEVTIVHLNMLKPAVIKLAQPQIVPSSADGQRRLLVVPSNKPGQV